MKYRYQLLDAELGNIIFQFNDLSILDNMNICISYFIIDRETHYTIKTFKYTGELY